MAERQVTDEQLGAMLEASRDFAFQLLAEKGKLIPFGARAGQSGDIDFLRIADEETSEPLGDVYDQTQKLLSDQAGKEEILAAASVAHVAVEGGMGEESYESAIRIHVEASGFSRIVFAPYQVVQDEAAGSATIEPGKLIAQEADAVIFAG